MAETVEESDIETDEVFKVSFGYEDFYLTRDAAVRLREKLDNFLGGR